VALLQLRITDLATDIGHLTVYYKNELWNPLRGFKTGAVKPFVEFHRRNTRRDHGICH